MVADRPDKIKRTTGEVGKIPLLDDENIIESSLFVYYIGDKIVWGEYNFYGVRHLKAPLSSYFLERFGANDVDVRPIPDEKTLERMRKENIFKKFYVKVARENLSHICREL